MSDVSTTEPAAPKAPRKIKPRRKAKATALPREKVEDEFPGLTSADCCNTCKDGRCVITSNSFCGHPFKASHSTLPQETMMKIERARSRLTKTLR